MSRPRPWRAETGPREGRDGDAALEDVADSVEYRLADTGLLGGAKHFPAEVSVVLQFLLLPAEEVLQVGRELVGDRAVDLQQRAAELDRRRAADRAAAQAEPHERIVQVSPADRRRRSSRLTQTQT